MRKNITKGDTTFLEAYRQWGRIINIAVTGTSKYSPSVILNYRNSPDVVIWSAVLASSAFPNFLQPVELQLKNPRTGALEGFHVHGKSHLDGTIKNDIPIKEMAKLWGANYFVVSRQCNKCSCRKQQHTRNRSHSFSLCRHSSLCRGQSASRSALLRSAWRHRSSRCESGEASGPARLGLARWLHPLHVREVAQARDGKMVQIPQRPRPAADGVWGRSVRAAV